MNYVDQENSPNNLPWVSLPHYPSHLTNEEINDSTFVGTIMLLILQLVWQRRPTFISFPHTRITHPSFRQQEMPLFGNTVS